MTAPSHIHHQRHPHRVPSPVAIEDYGLIGDTETAGLVSRHGSIDWLCFPRFDSGACFSALLGTPDHGRWVLAPVDAPAETTRSYRDETLVLETTHQLDGAAVKVIDLMPVRDRRPDVVRIVEGVSGTVTMGFELAARFDYGKVIPFVRQSEGRVDFVAGPDALRLRSPVELRVDDDVVYSTFDVAEGDRLAFRLTWHRSHEQPPEGAAPLEALEATVRWWREWADRCEYRGEWDGLVRRSLLVLKAMTYAPTGGIVAAPTTSLPEAFGGERNWDYRYCWVRDATFTLDALMEAGYRREAVEWRDWLVRAVAGRPDQLQMLYGASGERRLTELELDWLPGYEGSRPVRIGNEAVSQFQLDVYGEVMDVMDRARRSGVEPDERAWDIQRELLDFLEGRWDEPDEGIWEVRGGPRHFIHSKVMAWVAFDRAVRAVDDHGLAGAVDRWRRLRDQIHREVCEKGFRDDRPGRPSFTQSYDTTELDGALLMLPIVGFLPPDDHRIRATVAAVGEELGDGGLIRRYSPERSRELDDLSGHEGVFLPCSFWMVDALCMTGQMEKARELFERVTALANDLHLLSEEYDPRRRRLAGNFPQALSHLALVNSACNLAGAGPGPAEKRAHEEGRR